MDELKKGEEYTIEWVDGDYKTRCTFIETHRNFYIFEDENGMKVVCRPESIISIVKVQR